MTQEQHPPIDRRCQIYVSSGDDYPAVHLRPCENEGTHWVKWDGCACEGDAVHGGCPDDFQSWECDDPSHGQTEKSA